MKRRRTQAAALFLVAVLLGLATPANSRTSPVDCFPDRVVWSAAGPDPSTRFGAANLPGIVLGPPGDSPPVTGSLTVASLGSGGAVVLEWIGIVIEDRPGADFTIFENAFFVGAAPADASSDYVVFAEPARVEISEDGESWYAFSYDAKAVAESTTQSVDSELHGRLRGVAGIGPTTTGNWTVAEDPESFGTQPGGLEGAGGDAFDLAGSGMTAVRFVRITDLAVGAGAAGSGEGFDLDAVIVHHGRPTLPASAADFDGDGLPDLAESRMYGTDPFDDDSDGDGVDDGRELAGCRNPFLFDDAAKFTAPTALRLDDKACTEFVWAFGGTGTVYDLVAAPLGAATLAGDEIDWGPLSCIAGSIAPNRWSCDAWTPPPGEVRVYWVVPSSNSGIGFGSEWRPRSGSGGCP